MRDQGSLSLHSDLWISQMVLAGFDSGFGFLFSDSCLDCDIPMQYRLGFGLVYIVLAVITLIYSR
jgi:hypothetical protein